MLRKNNTNEVAQKLDTIIAMMEQMDTRIKALESAKTTTKKSTPTESASTNKSTEVVVLKGRVTANRLAKLYHEEDVRVIQIGKTIYDLTEDSDGLVYQNARKDTPKSETKASPKKKTPKSKGVDIMDFEPCKYKGTDNYVWGGAKGYKTMRSAYCYASQTDGKAKNLGDVYKLGIQIDFDKAWKKSKAEFEKKFHYVKVVDRQ